MNSGVMRRKPGGGEELWLHFLHHLISFFEESGQEILDLFVSCHENVYPLNAYKHTG